MKKTLLLILLSVCSGNFSAQTEKSVKPLPDLPSVALAETGTPSSAKASADTRAVVIGISDYQDPQIPDLRFADRDAEAFYRWLHNQEACALPDSNIQLLTNKKATTAQMMMAMDWLIDVSKSGDQAFLYFSGHGDVERITEFQRGYLLSYNSPPAVYGAGAFPLSYLQDIITTLSNKGVQVFVITDACRAGKLAGSSVNGTHATAAQLSQQYAKEIKILSCQPDEFSLEGEQWGGGRGCFSYHLEDALYGFADENHDAVVDLRELRRFLEDHVSKEAAPQSQTPMVSGPAQTSIATIHEAAFAVRKAAKGNGIVPFLAIDSKGLESRLLEKTDSSIRHLYAQFLSTLDSGHLMSPPGQCANDYFKLLVEKPEIASLHGTMKRKLAAALMDEGQTVLNKVLKTDPQVLDNIWANRVNYDHLPAYFQRATEILGEGHYAYRDVKAKEYLFRGMTVRAENYPDSTVEWLYGEKRRLLTKSLSYDSSDAVTYYLIGFNYENRASFRSALEHYQKSASLSPDWALIHYALGDAQEDPKAAIYEYKKSIELDSNFIRPYNRMAVVYEFYLNQIDSANICRKTYVRKFLQKMEEDPAQIKAFECSTAGNALWSLREYEKAKMILLLGERISKGNLPSIYGNLGMVYTDLLEFENAIHAHEKIAPEFKEFYNGIGFAYFHFLNDPNKAIDAFSKAGKRLDACQIQFHLSTGNFPTAFAQSKILMNVGPDDTLYLYNDDYEACYFYYFAAEAARQMNLPDTANYYYQKIVTKTSLEFKRNKVQYPNYLFVALSYAQLGKTEYLSSLLETSKEKLAGDPWMHFYLACIYAQTKQEQVAIESLNQAIELGWQPSHLAWYMGTLCDPMLDPIREHEPFKKLVREHFPKYYDIATRIPGKH